MSKVADMILQPLVGSEVVANAIAALCAGDGEWINGQVVFANGGFL